MMKRLLTCLFLIVALHANAQYDMYRAYQPNIDKKELIKGSEVRSKYDWTGITKGIIKGCSTEKQKARAIYNYICENISYDTNYQIYHVDQCWEQKKGVCQAYSELFYCMATAVGLECHIISGSKVNHAWNGVKINGKWMLLDSTWGAGWVNGNVYGKRKFHDLWWDVDPYWMMFTHYPDESEWQLLGKKYSTSEFDKLPRISPMDCFGLSGQKVMNGVLSGKLIQLPKFYDDDNTVRFKVKSIPMTSTLMAGKTYTFKFKPESGVKWAVINEGDWFYDWVVDAKGIYTMKVTPKKKGKLTISVQKSKDVSSYTTAMEYQVSSGIGSLVNRLHK